MPILEITSGAPGVLYNNAAMEWWAFAYNTGYAELVNEEYEKFNVHMPYTYAHLGAILMSNKICTVPEDFEGLQFGGIGIIFLEQDLVDMGAGIVPIGGSDIYTGFATGLIDATLWSHAATNYKMGWHEVSKYWHYPPLLPQNVEDIMVNLDFWNSLPEEYQGLIELLCVEWGNAYTYTGYYEAALALSLVKADFGIETPTFSAELNAKLTELSMDNINAALVAETDPAAIEGWGLYLDFLEQMGY
jgi:TRAP-type mannitol/chloroaromatic compound transport system substrate-binding protein